MSPGYKTHSCDINVHLTHTTGEPAEEPPEVAISICGSRVEALPEVMASMVAAIPALSLYSSKTFDFIALKKKTFH